MQQPNPQQQHHQLQPNYYQPGPSAHGNRPLQQQRQPQPRATGPPPPQQQQQQQQQQRGPQGGMPPGVAGGPGGQMQGIGGPGGPGQMGPPPQGMQRGPPPGQQVIGPSHPQHPQHHLWLQQQQREHGGGGGPGPPPQNSHNYLPQPPPHLQQQQGQQLRPGQQFHSGPPPPQQQQHNPHLPQPQPLQSQLPHPQQNSGSFPPPPQSHPHSLQGQQAPPARQIPSAASMRGPPPSLQHQQQQPQGLPQPPPQHVLPHPPSSVNGGGSVYAPSPQPMHASLPRPPPQHQQPPPQQPPFLQPQHTGPPNGIPHGVSLQQRPTVRTSTMGPPPANTLLAAHLAIHGTGPITATAAPAGPALSRLAALNDAVIQASEDLHPLEAMRAVIAEHFTDSGVVKVGLYDKGAQLSKVFEIPCSAWPRFQHLNIDLGVVASALHTTFAREYRLTTPDPSSGSPSQSQSVSPDSVSPPSAASSPSPYPVHIGYLLRAEDAVWTSRFRSGTKIDLLGTLTMHLMFKDLGTGAAGLRIESLEFESRGHEEWIARGAMESVLTSMVNEVAGAGPSERSALSGALLGGVKTEEGAGGGSRGGKEKERPKSKKGNTRETRGMVTRRRSASQKSTIDHPIEDDSDEDEEEEKSVRGEQGRKRELSNEERLQQMRSVSMPVTPVGPFGVTEMGMRCLEIAESVAQLQDLIAFSLDTGIGPVESLARYAERHRSGSFSNGPGGGGGGGGGGPPGSTPMGQGPPPPGTPSSNQPHLHHPPAPFSHQQQQQQHQQQLHHLQQQHQHLHQQQQQPSSLPIAASHQNPSTNSFYSSVTASPGPGPASNLHNGEGRRRPGSSGLANGGGGGGGGDDVASPAGPGNDGGGGGGGPGGKRRMSGVMNGAMNGDSPAASVGGDDPGSPQKIQRVGGGGGRGRGRGR